MSLYPIFWPEEEPEDDSEDETAFEEEAWSEELTSLEETLEEDSEDEMPPEEAAELEAEELVPPQAARRSELERSETANNLLFIDDLLYGGADQVVGLLQKEIIENCRADVTESASFRKKTSVDD